MNSPVSQISSSSDRGPVGRYVSIWNRRKVSSVAPTVVDFMSFGQHLGIWRDADRSAPQPRHTSVSVRFATNENAELYADPIDPPSPTRYLFFIFPPIISRFTVAILLQVTRLLSSLFRKHYPFSVAFFLCYFVTEVNVVFQIFVRNSMCQFFSLLLNT